MTFTVTRLNSVHAPQITTLSNGLTIITEQIPVCAVNLNIWFNIGSAVESDEINGMAHFLEHMIFKGTEKLPAGEFERFLEARGAVTNAATSQEYTHYYFTCAPQDFADILPWQLDLVCNPLIPEEEFARERMVVLEEIRRAQDNPGRRVSEKTTQMAFPHLPYSRPILGTSEIIQGVTPKQMQSFHRSWYQPLNMTIVAVGNLPTEELTEQVINTIEKKESKLPINTLSYLPELPFDDIVTDEYVDKSLQQSRLILMWRVPGFIDLDETLALDVLAIILGRGKLSRLFRDLRETRHLVHRISASNITYKMQGAFSVSAELSQEKLPLVQDEILKHIEQIQQEGVTPKELERVCQNVANQFIFQSEKPSDRTNLYGYYYSQLNTLTPALEYVQKVRMLTVDDIQQATIKYCPLNAYGVVKAIDS
jgi:predicted Zn-dependent peptidase